MTLLIFFPLSSFCQRVKLEGLSQSVNMCDINICVANWREAGFIILALAQAGAGEASEDLDGDPALQVQVDSAVGNKPIRYC